MACPMAAAPLRRHRAAASCCRRYACGGSRPHAAGRAQLAPLDLAPGWPGRGYGQPGTVPTGYGYGACYGAWDGPRTATDVRPRIRGRLPRPRKRSARVRPCSRTVQFLARAKSCAVAAPVARLAHVAGR